MPHMRTIEFQKACAFAGNACMKVIQEFRVQLTYMMKTEKLAPVFLQIVLDFQKQFVSVSACICCTLWFCAPLKETISYILLLHIVSESSFVFVVFCGFVHHSKKSISYILLLHIISESSFVFVAFYGCVHHSKSSHILDSYLTLGIWQDGDKIIRIFRHWYLELLQIREQ